MLPQTVIKIYRGVPLVPTKPHRILLNNKEAFLSGLNTNYLVKTYNHTLTRDERVTGTIRLEGFAMDYEDCNYMLMNTPSSSGQNILDQFCFIDEIRYVNDSLYEVSYTIDLFSTYIYQVDLSKVGYVIRHHVNDDVYGRYTKDEQLETGEYMSDLVQSSTFSQDYCLLVNSTIDLEGKDSTGGIYGGLYNGGSLIAFRMTSGGQASFEQYIYMLNTSGKISAIISMYMVPSSVVSGTLDIPTWDVRSIPNTDNATYLGQLSVPIPNRTNGFYTPKNRKLCCYPFQYLLVNNGSGETQAYHYELFSTSTANFDVYGVPSPGECITMAPYAYAYSTSEKQQGCERLHYLGMGNYPSVSWQNDVYANWLAQTQGARYVNYARTAVQGAKTLFGVWDNFKTGGIKGAITGSISDLADTALSVGSHVAELHDKEIQPNSVGGQASLVNIMFSLKNNGKVFSFYNRYLREEYARTCDDYLSAYGYTILETLNPNFYGRTYWNYVKVLDYPIVGNIPMTARNQIDQLFSNGVTLWHTWDVGNYNLNNQ